jgi:hypothetical protein
VAGSGFDCGGALLGNCPICAGADYKSRVGGLRGDHHSGVSVHHFTVCERSFKQMSSTYTNVAFTSREPDQPTAMKLNKLRDDLSAAIKAGGTGTGDMTKAVYDTNGDGVSDHAALADAVPWTGVSGKPTSFVPSAHAGTHLAAGSDPIALATSVLAGLCPAVDNTTIQVVTSKLSCVALAWTAITGKPATFPPDSTAMLKSVYDINADNIVDHAALADAAPWTGITGKPATFPPDSTAMLKSVYDTNSDGISDHAALADTAPWTGVTGKPATFPPSAHAASHLDNGADAIPVATTSRTGSLRVLNGTATTFLDGTGNWSTPAPAGTVNPGTWTNLSYGTGWTQNTVAQYRVETNGSFQKVICQGIINYASGAASLAFTLPAGAQPGVTRGCVLSGFDSSGDVLLFSANVSTTGAVTILPMCRQGFVWPSATNGSVYLDNLSFAL